MKIWMLLVILTIVSAAPLRAEKMHLDVLLKEAEANNPAVLARRARWQAALGAATEAGGLPDPKLSVSVMPAALETRAGPVKGKASISQALPFWGKRGLREEAAQGRAGAAEAAYRAKILEVRSQLASTYYDLAFLFEARRIYAEQVELLRHFSRVAEKKYSVGRGAQAIVFRSQAELSRMKNEVFKAEQGAKSARARLAALLGREPAGLFGEPAGLPMPAIAWDKAALGARALLQRPELLALRALENSSEAERRLTLRRWFPDFTVGYERTAIGAGTTNAMFDGKVAQGVTVGLSLPLWFGRNRAGVARGKDARRAAAFDAAGLEYDTRADLETLITDAETFLELAQVDENTVLPQVRSAVQATLSGYEADTASFVDLLDAERAQLVTELGHAMHKSMFWKTSARLERVVGGPL